MSQPMRRSVASSSNGLFTLNVVIDVSGKNFKGPFANPNPPEEILMAGKLDLMYFYVKFHLSMNPRTFTIMLFIGRFFAAH